MQLNTKLRAVLSPVPGVYAVRGAVGVREMEQRAELLCLNAVPAPLTLPGCSCECSTGKEGENWLFLTASRQPPPAHSLEEQ